MKVVHVDKMLHNPNGITKNSYEPYIISPHCHFFHIVVCSTNLIKPRFEINLAQIFCLIESIQQIINAKHIIIIIYCYFIQGMVVNTYLQLVVLFINKQDM
jgi:hypothetical protein